MSMSSGMNGWSNPSKAKKAYLRRHGLNKPPTVTVDSPHSVVPPSSRRAPATGELTLGGGLASISEQLYSRVTTFHAQIGSSATVASLLSLESRLLDQAEAAAGAGEWEEGLNVFTHALAVTEKLRAAADSSTYASTQAAIVMHIGTCLHHLEELEAVSAGIPQNTRLRHTTAPPPVRSHALPHVSMLAARCRQRHITRRRLLTSSACACPLTSAGSPMPWDA